MKITEFDIFEQAVKNDPQAIAQEIQAKLEMTPEEMKALSQAFASIEEISPFTKGIRDGVATKVKAAKGAKTGTLKEEELDEAVFGMLGKSDKQIIALTADLNWTERSKWDKEQKETYEAARLAYIEGGGEKLRLQLALPITNPKSIFHKGPMKNEKVQKAIKLATGCKKLVPACLAKAAAISAAMTAATGGIGGAVKGATGSGLAAFGATAAVGKGVEKAALGAARSGLGKKIAPNARGALASAGISESKNQRSISKEKLKTMIAEELLAAINEGGAMQLIGQYNIQYITQDKEVKIALDVIKRYVAKHAEYTYGLEEYKRMLEIIDEAIGLIESITEKKADERRKRMGLEPRHARKDKKDASQGDLGFNI